MLLLLWPLPPVKTPLQYAFQPFVKGALEGLRQFLITENLLKMIKTAFYFTLNALFVLKIFTFLS